MMANIDPDKLGKALARIEDSKTRDGNAGGTHALVTGVQPRGNDQGHGGGARWYRGCRGNACGERDAKGHQHQHQQQQWASQPPCNTSGSHEAAISTTAAAAAAIRTPWRVGTIACCLFPLRPARTFLCRMSSDTSRAAKHVPPSTVHCPVG